MSIAGIVCRPTLLLFVCASFAGASTGAYSPPLNAWLDEVLDLSLFRLFVPPPDVSATLPGIASPLTPLPCAIGPIPPLDDEEALAFEGGSQVDLNGLTPATARALNRFERRVTLLGGKMAVTSAYRPPAYQAHLQVVWDKWDQLRDAHEEGCAVVRAQAQEEFEHHGLLESQRPVPFSDHTRGIAFDASILLPARKRRPSIDRLARSAGVLRPDIRHDPVHFRLVDKSAGT